MKGEFQMQYIRPELGREMSEVKVFTVLTELDMNLNVMLI